MDKLQKLERAVHVVESVNTVTMFVLPPLAAIYGVWQDDWRPFGTTVIIWLTVFSFGICVLMARDRAKKTIGHDGRR